MPDDLRERAKAVIRSYSEAIADDLFINGAGDEAERLVLLDKDGRDLGGWCKRAAVDRIEAMLLRKFLT